MRGRLQLRTNQTLEIVGPYERHRLVAARLLPNATTGAGPILLSGALSPVYFNNAAFRIGKKSGAIVSLVQVQRFQTYPTTSPPTHIVPPVEYDDETHRPVGMAVYFAPISPGGSAPLRWRLGINMTSAYPALANAVERDGWLSQQAYAELQTALAEGGEDWNVFARWYS